MRLSFVHHRLSNYGIPLNYLFFSILIFILRIRNTTVIKIQTLVRNATSSRITLSILPETAAGFRNYEGYPSSIPYKYPTEKGSVNSHRRRLQKLRRLKRAIPHQETSKFNSVQNNIFPQDFLPQQSQVRMHAFLCSLTKTNTAFNPPTQFLGR